MRFFFGFTYNAPICFHVSGNLTAQGESGYFERAINRWGHANARPDYKNMTLFEETRYLLYTFYKPFNQALARVMNDPNFDYGPY